MEKLQTLLFILLGLGIFVWRMLKKAAETTAREVRERRRQSGKVAPALPDTSFQELLRQMQQQNRVPQTSPAAPHAPAGPTSLEKPAEVPHSLERPKLRPVSLEEPATKRAARTPEPTIRRAAELPRATAVAPIEDYWTKQSRQAPSPSTAGANRRGVLAALRNPANVRTAFILSEILRRPE